MSQVLDHPRGDNPLGLAVARTVYIVNLCNQPDCAHPILFTSTDLEKARTWLRERAATETDPSWRLDLYRRQTLIDDREIFSPLLHVDAQGETALDSDPSA